MAKKTVLKEVLKYAPKSIELQKTIEADSTIKNEIAADMSDIIDVTDYIVVEEQAEEKSDDNELAPGKYLKTS